jgi:hypothetical protein
VYIFQYLYDTNDLTVGHVSTEKDFQETINHVRLSADRLHKIMEKARELEKVWHGKETFTI